VAVPLPGTGARGGFPTATLATLRPLAAGSARRNLHLTPQAAAWNPPLRTGSPVGGQYLIRYAHDLSPARCRFRSPDPVPRSRGRFAEPPAAPYGTGRLAWIRCRICEMIHLVS